MRFHFATLAFVALLGAPALAQSTTARNTGNETEAFQRANGSPIHRFTTTPDDSTAETNASASGGAAVTYTLTGGERLCFQTPEDAYVQVASTFSAALAFTVFANQPLFANCFTLQGDAKTVTTRCVTGSCAGIKAFEVR